MNGDGKKILGPNEEGEVYVKSSCVMLCYYKNPNATMIALDSESIKNYFFTIYFHLK